MRPRIFIAVALSVCTFSVLKPDRRVAAEAEQLDLQQDFRQRLQKLAVLSPDPCGPHSPREKEWTPADSEFRLFSRAADIVTEALNAASSNAKSPKERAAAALGKLEEASSEINADWPEDSRFHFQILNIPPLLVVKTEFRTSARYFAFGVPHEEVSEKDPPVWHEVGSDDVSLQQESARSLIELFELHSGPSGNARFLARIEPFGCAGSIGVVYDALEWNPEGIGSFKQIIHQGGSFGLDDNAPGFPQIGELRTDSSLITLPYCWFSAIDTWDNPSLCAVDTYDLSGDVVKFQSRAYNRPDLVPVAKAIGYARERDSAAARGYCASSEIADRLVRELPPHFYAEEIQVNATGKGSERVELGDGPAYWFEVEERQGSWVVVDFGEERTEDSPQE
jgi:hypothetical protein